MRNMRKSSAPNWRADEEEWRIKNKARAIKWRMVLLHPPKSGGILRAAPMYRQWNNALCLDEMGRVADGYPLGNRFIYDRAYSILKDVTSRKKAPMEIRTYTTDKFRGAGQKPTSRANPPSNPPHTMRIDGLNASIADQTFPLFRRYARSIAGFRRGRHKFLVSLYAKMQNTLFATGQSARLTP